MAEPEARCGHCGGPLVVRETDPWCPIDGQQVQGSGAPPTQIMGLLATVEHEPPYAGTPDMRITMMARALCPNGTRPAPCQPCIDLCAEGLARNLSRAMRADVEEPPRG